MNHPFVETYDRYLAAWSDVSTVERESLLNQSLSDRIVFANPQQNRSGKRAVAEHLEGFQRRMPGGSFRMNNMVGWGDCALAEWQLVDATGCPGFSGYDVVTFDSHGLITEILLFGNVEAQKLAWRRRDPVALQLTD
ncbi:SnoaL-like domain-containing protein [Sphingomonas guangdongensis]|uniref:SnoaL-like domain-containing protein n=1 Tax=Sphingomonas guangdongensis TaxID=1141890 RepID=A0A285QYQ6_9SPHN|nr:nuclear transport factor 2 family protein [Sphingomonas guangdongensis]SOB87105.1 SnoaL-like domain-containing protein [Sphingomonas guangdongensis]